MSLLNGVFCIVQYSTSTIKIKVGYFAPPPFDSSAVKGTPTVANPKEVGYNEIDAKVYKLSICGAVINTACGKKI